MTYYRKQLPKYCLHKGTGRAFVRIGGKTYYLGKHGSETSRREYDRIIAEFIANGRQPFQNPDEILIENLIARFLDHVHNEQDYGNQTQTRFGRVLKKLNHLYGKQRVSQFGPAALKVVRRQYLDEGLSLPLLMMRQPLPLLTGKRIAIHYSYRVPFLRTKRRQGTHPRGQRHRGNRRKLHSAQTLR